MPIPIIIVAAFGVAVWLTWALLRRRRKATSDPPQSDPPPAPTFSAPVPEFRVVALGPSGSGKTVLLSSMFHELSYFSPRRSYFLDTSPQDRLLLNNLYEEVSDTARPWPRATGRSTAETKEYQFRCVGRGQDDRTHTVAQISYLDFAGVLLEDAALGGSESFAKVHSAIEQASAVLVLIDGRRVRQLLNNEPEGRLHFAFTLQSTLGFAQNATCPLHLVVTKWDLIQDFAPLRGVDDATKLEMVVDALMHYDHLKALVDARSGGQILRVIPVSSVGRGFVEVDADGRVVKRAEATPAPTNIEAPLAAVVPDFFQQVEAKLDVQTRRAVNAQLRERMRLGAGEFVAALATMVGRPAGVVLRGVLTSFVGADFGDGVYTLFLDFVGRDFEAKENEVRSFRSETERQIAVMRAVRSRVLQDFTRSVQRLEDAYPQSLQGGVQWQARS